MITRRIARLENLLLKPLSFWFPILAVIYFFHRAWFIGGFLLLAWFCVGLIGQSLHRDKTFAQLARGGLTSEENIIPDSELSSEEAHKLARPLFLCSWLCGITVAVLLFHHDYRWFIALLLGLVITICTSIIFGIIALRPKK